MRRAMARPVAVVAAAAVVAFAAPYSAAAQQLTSQQIEQLRQNPELVRTRIEQSGLLPGVEPSQIDQLHVVTALRRVVHFMTEL